MAAPEGSRLAYGTNPNSLTRPRDDASANIPADVGKALENLAKQEGLDLNELKAYVKAAGMCDKDYDDKKESVVPDLFSFPKKERPLIALKILFSDGAIAWHVTVHGSDRLENKQFLGVSGPELCLKECHRPKNALKTRLSDP